MDTERFFFTNDLNIDTEKLQIAELNEEELSIVRDYIEITRHIQEIDQLFLVFRFNLSNLFLHFNLLYSDTIEAKFDFETSESIAINALTVNFISSGKTLIESIESFLKLNHPDLYKEFRTSHLSKEYDQHFQYRFLLRLRDYAQHGHLPVSKSFDDRYCFNLETILFTPHFNHNSSMRNDMEDISAKIYEEFSGYPNIALTHSLAEFNICITRNYLGFLKSIRNLLHEYADRIHELINSRPEIIYKSSDILNGHIFYEVIDNKIHSFSSKDNPKKMLSDYKN